MTDNWKYRAVWRDLLTLPLGVFVRRIKKRVLPNSSAKYNVKVEEKPVLVSIVSVKPTEVSEETQWVVNQYVKGKADFLGSGWVSYQDWQKDPVSQFSWDATKPSSEQLALGLKQKGADVKLPWEFARMHQILRVSTYRNDSKAESHLVDVVNSFKSQNEIGKGVHWMNAMEVAIRAINIMVSCDLQKNRSENILNFIQEHLIFVLNHLERKEGLGNNHYLANLLGLLFGLVYFPEWKEFQNHKVFVVSEFCTEVKKQFYSDGGNFEGSTYYHALSTEIAILGLACLNKMELSSEINSIKKVVHNAYSFLKLALKPNGELPQFGDNDSGRILPFSISGNWMTSGERSEKYLNKENSSFTGKEYVENPLDVSGIVKFGDALFGHKGVSIESHFIKFFGEVKLESDYKPKEFFMEDLGIMLPFEKDWQIEIPKIDLEQLETYAFPDFGLVIIKSKEFYLAMSLLERQNAHRYRGHFHNDQLSVDLWVKGKQFLSDPGNITYTGSMDKRNAMRSAKAHNAPFIGEEPNRFMPGLMGLFHMMDETNVELYQFSKNQIRAALFFKNSKLIRNIKITEGLVSFYDSASEEFSLNLNNDLESDGYGRELRK